MSIKKISIWCLPILLVALLVFSTGCITIVGIGDGPLISGSGSLETREMDYDDFTKIDCVSTLTPIIATGTPRKELKLPCRSYRGWSSPEPQGGI